MAFPAEIIRSGVGIANSLTLGVQSPITHYAWISQSVAGDDTYDDPVTLLCVIDRTNRVIVRDGEHITIGATLAFVGDVAPNGAVGRREPIDPRDKIVLPDGFTGPIIDSPGSVIDPDTERGFIQSVMLGAR